MDTLRILSSTNVKQEEHTTYIPAIQTFLCKTETVVACCKRFYFSAKTNLLLHLSPHIYEPGCEHVPSSYHRESHMGRAQSMDGETVPDVGSHLMASRYHPENCEKEKLVYDYIFHFCQTVTFWQQSIVIGL